MTSLSTPWTAAAPALQAVVHDLLANYSDLRRYLSGRLRNPDDAADIAQSSFAQAYAHALNAPVLNARALLFQAARNLCIDQYRRRSNELAALEDWLTRADALSPSVEEIIIAREQLQQLIERIERMPRLRREVFVRVRLHGQPHRQVCAELELSAKAVELHIARAVFDLSELSLAARHA
ncbi:MULTISPECIES: RNA polymerase sigma factor [Pseudomonas]|uniref:Sigma-70 family RNA polymerase sigma factor n=1 Tax=Pseudomonas donghuensis TaxID=1163398 RepID=A0AAP0SBM6_9PSED|nr:MULTISPECIES: RNA polymerase sigma factor [Pseudomonas]MDF9895090.1 RNA polymerase sigma-70 factor (ECF subfamily) [Pseudomonas vranovensis]KDN97651.1 sigma-70 family RNA polymerase sigma factor [Pseudomonas donghuensis]MBF4206754.1 sigma-70 family RNA polymerase sigma factor [Pseudomonas donghuensis]MBS7597551.1 sigma-70 family RNA polymerase sigma factor [Pseudomonas sp. RC2C2]MCP6690618.1 RNA polymerase sigma factor [Pseudomonas donghuensis]